MKGLLMTATSVTTLKKNIAFTLLCCTVLMMFVAGSTVAWAQCPTSPNYSPDFTGASSPACLTLNNNGDIGYPGFYTVVNPPTPPPVVKTVLRLTPNAIDTAGSAWYNTQQPVVGAFSTTFTFELSNPSAGSQGPADGIAFVIQNSPAGTGALGPDGCGIGFGDSDYCISSTGGIPNSLAVEFNTFNNGTGVDPSNNDVTIQNCSGTGANSVDQSCSLAFNDLTLLSPPINMADGNVHTVTITYTPSTLSTCGPEGASTCSSLDVILDGNDLFPPTGANPALFNLNSIGLTSGTAFVGFTGATGGGDDNQDILSWTFTPQTQTAVVSTTAPTVYSFLNGSGATAYEYTGQLNSGSPTAVTVTPIQTTPAICNALVQLTYPGAQCFVYGNLSPNPDSAVMFELTCPGLTNGICNPLDAELGTIYTLSTEAGVNMYNHIDPFPGLLKGDGGVLGHPCSTALLNGAALFKSNQIDLFSTTEFPDPGSHGSGGNTGSCWVATYNQPDEKLSGITITSPTNTSYAQGANITASYTCSNPTSSKLPELPAIGNPVGPYLTAASCTQATGTQSSCTPPSPSPGGGISCTGTVPTSTVGPQTFTVTAMDSGTNTSTQSVNYTVVAPTNLAIGNLATPLTAPTGSKITYNIGVGDFGPASAVGVMVTDPLPSNTEFVSASGSNCSLSNKGLVCTPVSCSNTGNTVSCSVGTLAPLSFSSLNGAVLKITAQVTGQPTTTCKVINQQKPCTINTATVSAINTDTNSNNSASAQTIW
jgi:uncharacterized repeat protein (TIGR01451 family)